MEMPAKYRKKPVVIEAVRYDGSNDREIVAWIKDNGGAAFRSPAVDPGKVWHIGIRTLEGTMRTDMGDYVIRGVQGEFYPCKPDIFEATYEPA